MRNKRPERLSSNVVTFPATIEKRFDLALANHARGDDAAAMKELLALIDDGCSAAYGYVALFYEMGSSGVPVDFKKARFYYQKGIEEYGSLEDYLGLARIYYLGRGVDPDYCKAFEYYDLVAKEAKDNGIAYLMLGQMYQRGECVDKDYQRAKECYENAWQKGYILGLTYLGLLEQERGHYFKGWLYRLKAGLIGFSVSIKKPRDNWQFRGC